jgi:SAM-dependent methyltransferase
MSYEKQAEDKAFYEDIWADDDWSDMMDNSPAPFHRRRLILAEVGKRSREINSILDYGCGNGRLLRDLKGKLSKADLKLIGSDLSHKVIEINTSKDPSITWEQFNLDEDDVRDHADLVTCTEVLEHVSDWKVCLDKLIMSANKYVILTVPAGKVFAIDKKVGHVDHFTKKQIAEYLDIIGQKEYDIYYWGWPFHTLYKNLININPEKIYSNFGSRKYSTFEKLVSKVINSLFYFNFKRFFFSNQLVVVIKK